MTTIRHHITTDKRSLALYSDCETYRYALIREWRVGRRVCFVMLNPSTATERQNDPTVERCERRARRMGFGSFSVANIFALRSTDPNGLYTCTDPIGSQNDANIIELATAADLVVCAWGGTHGNHMGRGKAVLEMLCANGVEPHYLRLNKDGSPAHPLYLPYSAQPRPFE